MSELKRCPFCASRSAWVYKTSKKGEFVGNQVLCERCWASGPLMNGATSNQACSLWEVRKDNMCKIQTIFFLLTALGVASSSILMAIIWGQVGFWAVWMLYFGVLSVGSFYLLTKGDRP